MALGIRMGFWEGSTDMHLCCRWGDRHTDGQRQETALVMVHTCTHTHTHTDIDMEAEKGSRKEAEEEEEEEGWAQAEGSRQGACSTLVSQSSGTVDRRQNLISSWRLGGPHSLILEQS